MNILKALLKVGSFAFTAFFSVLNALCSVGFLFGIWLTKKASVVSGASGMALAIPCFVGCVITMIFAYGKQCYGRIISLFVGLMLFPISIMCVPTPHSSYGIFWFLWSIILLLWGQTWIVAGVHSLIKK